MRRTALVMLLITSVITLGMGGKMPPPDSGVTPQTYEENFRELARQYGAVLIGKSLAFTFKFLMPPVIGVCTTRSSGNNSIALSSSAWQNNSETFKEMLAFHEMGHCLLGRGHKNTNHSDGRKESIMASSIFSTRVYQEHRDEYLKELFTVVRDVFGRSLVSGQDKDRVFDDCKFGK